jgi:peroxisomal 3,2-trans-enoyl-CoA isomerase
MGVHRANEFVMFGKKIEARDLKSCGLVNQVFEQEHFEEKVMQYLEHMLKINDGGSMMEAKRLQNMPLRDSRMLAVYNSIDALAERFVHGAPIAIFAARKRDMEGKYLPVNRLMQTLH